MSRVIVLSVLVLSAACAKPGPASAPSAGGPTAPSASAPASHGSAAALPGSHEDWCGEHGVPESLCTRCNPSLIPAFKATGDWCAAHGLPESQCLACNPDLRIERPASPGGK